MRNLWFLLILGLGLPAMAQAKGGVGDLMVTPTRVELEGRERSAEIMLRNSGPAPCTYRVSFQEMRMVAFGKLEIVPKAEGTVTASDLVRFSPRQVDLAPGEAQMVRVQLNLPEGLKDGEYRSHLVFQGVPKAEPPAPLGPDAPATALSINLQTVVSISIPIIVRHGETSATVAVSHLAYHPAAKPGEPPTLDLQMERKGNRSVQGEFKVDWVPRSGRARTLVSGLGAAMYPELDTAQVQLPLADGKDLAVKDGQLKVTYTLKDSKQAPIVATLDVP